MTLLNGHVENSYVITDIHLTGNIRTRLEAMGLTPGTTVEILNMKKNGSMICKVRGTRLAVGRKISGAVMIGMADTDNTGGVVI